MGKNHRLNSTQFSAAANGVVIRSSSSHDDHTAMNEEYYKYQAMEQNHQLYSKQFPAAANGVVIPRSSSHDGHTAMNEEYYKYDQPMVQNHQLYSKQFSAAANGLVIPYSSSHDDFTAINEENFQFPPMEQDYQLNSIQFSAAANGIVKPSSSSHDHDTVINEEYYDFPPMEPELDSMQFSVAASGVDIAESSSHNDDTATKEDYFKSFPPGYRFCPTDEELIERYLKKKVNNETLPPNLIRDVNLYSKDPSQLAEEYPPISDTDRYFFTSRAKKYPNGSRPNRATPSGYWKPTGTDKEISSDSGEPGFKKTLDFYIGKHPEGEKTNWKMHEYKVKVNDPQNNVRDKNDMTLDDWVLCKLYKKKGKNGDEDEAGTSASQPTVNLSSQNEASSSMVEKNNEFEEINTSQPTSNQRLLHEDASTHQRYSMLSRSTEEKNDFWDGFLHDPDVPPEFNLHSSAKGI